MKNQPFIIHLSNSVEIKIDGDEVEKVMNGIRLGAMVRVRQGIVNPSYIIAVAADKKRIELFLDDTKYRPERRQNGPELLKDILADMKLPGSSEIKRLK